MGYLRWIDTLDFQDHGQWKVDTQFTHLMGSSYLLACHTPGKPVQDATTRFAVPKNGRYRIWARTKNWYYPYAPGRFELLVDGQNSGVELGTLASTEWAWQIAGDYALAEGQHNLALHDLTGYFGRCSSLIVTDDMDFVPARPIEEFERQRAMLRGISLEPVNEGRYDVVVAGAGPGGVPAAIAAARHGCRVLLLNNRPVIGGNASEEAGVQFNGASARQLNARDGGITEEIMRLKGYRDCSWMQAMEQLCRQEPNLEIRCNLHIIGADMAEDTIVSVVARHTVHGTRHRFFARQFIDCTGDAWLGYYAGSKYRIGREADWQAQEEFAPEQPDLLTMSGLLMNPQMVDVGHPVDYIAPDWVPRLPEGRRFGRNIEHIGMVWWVEAPNVLDDVYDAEMTRDELFRIQLAYFDYLKNRWDEKEKATCYEFRFINYIDAKRESRRLIGDYILDQNDCVSGKIFADAVGHTGWPIDIHHPQGIYSGEEGPFFSNAPVPMATIPYRCLYSVNVRNLFMAGRNISVTHVALGTARLQGTIANLGQAVGTAAALCVRKNLSPRELGQCAMEELRQQLLRDDQYIPGQYNRDTSDLARGCRVTASSESSGEAYVWRLGIEDVSLPLDRQRATFLARNITPSIPSVWLQLTNHTQQPIPLTVHVREQADPDGYVTEEDLCAVTRDVPPNGEHWVEFPLGLTVQKRYIWLWTDPVPGLSWRVIRRPPLDWTRSERQATDQPFPNLRGEAHSVSLVPPVLETASCCAENIINGYSRDEGPKRHLWASDPQQALPQWIQLIPETPQMVNCVQITFDSDMSNGARFLPIDPLPWQLVTDYDLEIKTRDGWQLIEQVTKNFQRRRVHRFADVLAQAVRVTVKGSGDGRTARIFEVRLYRDALDSSGK